MGAPSSCQSFIMTFIMPLGSDGFSRGTRRRCQSLVRDERPLVHKPLQNHCSTSKTFAASRQDAQRDASSHRTRNGSQIRG